jgi:hypothetical protein
MSQEVLLVNGIQFIVDVDRDERAVLDLDAPRAGAILLLALSDWRAGCGGQSRVARPWRPWAAAASAAGASSAAGLTTDTKTGFFLPCVTAFTPLGNVMSPKFKETPFFKPDKSTWMASGKSAGKQVISSSFMM